MRSHFRWVLWSVHCFLSQVVSEHQPNKAVYAQDQGPRPGFDLHVETGLSSAGAWPLLDGFVTKTHTDATGNLAQPCRKNICV